MFHQDHHHFAAVLISIISSIWHQNTFKKKYWTVLSTVLTQNKTSVGVREEQISDNCDSTYSSKGGYYLGWPHDNSKRWHHPEQPRDNSKRWHHPEQPRDNSKRWHHPEQPHDNSKRWHHPEQPRDNSKRWHHPEQPRDNSKRWHHPEQPHDNSKRWHHPEQPRDNSKRWHHPEQPHDISKSDIILNSLRASAKCNITYKVVSWQQQNVTSPTKWSQYNSKKWQIMKDVILSSLSTTAKDKLPEIIKNVEGQTNKQKQKKNR